MENTNVNKLKLQFMAAYPMTGKHECEQTQTAIREIISNEWKTRI
jgi:hypothetical protein